MLQNEAGQSAIPITAFTDISANIFALMLIALILAPLQRQAMPDPRSATEAGIVVVQRDALTASELIKHFYDRRAAAPGMRIDVHGNGCTIVAAGGHEQRLAGPAVEAALERMLREGQPSPVALYVFDHAWYPGVIRALRSAGLSWREVSVPLALRRPDAEAWSSEFTQLLEHARDLETFRMSLARLLAASVHRTARGENAGHAFDAGAGAEVNAPLLERIRTWWRYGSTLGAVLFAFTFIVWLERRTFKRLP